MPGLFDDDDDDDDDGISGGALFGVAAAAPAPKVGGLFDDIGEEEGDGGSMALFGDDPAGSSPHAARSGLFSGDDHAGVGAAASLFDDMDTDTTSAAGGVEGDGKPVGSLVLSLFAEEESFSDSIGLMFDGDKEKQRQELIDIMPSDDLEANSIDAGGAARATLETGDGSDNDSSGSGADSTSAESRYRVVESEGVVVRAGFEMTENTHRLFVDSIAA
eukprot:SAG31_NODE_4774_length_2965_cov_10.544313_1_plen_218_part_00